MYRAFNPSFVARTSPVTTLAPIAQAAGFRGYAVPLEEIERDGAERARSVLEAHDLIASCVALPVELRGDTATFRRDLELLPARARAAARVGYRRLSAQVSPGHASMTEQAFFDVMAGRLRECAIVLRDHAIVLGLEFLAPKTLRDALGVPYDGLSIPSRMLDLVEAIDVRGTGIVLDAWHWYVAGSDPTLVDRIGAHRLIEVHVNDAPRGVARDALMNRRRRLPGDTGVIDLDGLFAALTRAGYDGPVTVEPFRRAVDELPDDECVAALADSLDRSPLEIAAPVTRRESRRGRLVVVAGPPGANKSGVARSLASALDVPHVEARLFEGKVEIAEGYDAQRASQLLAGRGVAGLLRYREHFEIATAAHVLTQYRDAVVELGGTYGSSADAIRRARWKSLFTDVQLVWVEPSDDLEETTGILARRTGGIPDGERLLVGDLCRDNVLRDVATTRWTPSGAPCPALAAWIGTDIPPPAVPLDVDRLGYARFRAEQRVRLPRTTALLDHLEGVHFAHYARARAPFFPLASESLAPWAFAELWECGDAVLRELAPALAEASEPDAARFRAIVAAVTNDGKLTSLLHLDPFDGVLPFFDGPVLERLVGAEPLPAPERHVLAHTLAQRLLRAPQQSRHLFLHELLVGHVLDALRAGEVRIFEKEEHELGDDSPLPARMLERLAAHLAIPTSTLRALHFADDDTIDAALPEWLKDFGLVSSVLSFRVEQVVVYELRQSMRRARMDLLTAFCVPALERLLRRPDLVLRSDADDRIARAWDDAPPPVDHLAILDRLAQDLWVEASV